jgi:hypothetical protein
LFSITATKVLSNYASVLFETLKQFTLGAAASCTLRKQTEANGRQYSYFMLARQS